MFKTSAALIVLLSSCATTSSSKKTLFIEEHCHTSPVCIMGCKKEEIKSKYDVQCDVSISTCADHVCERTSYKNSTPTTIPSDLKELIDNPYTFGASTGHTKYYEIKQEE